MPYKLEVDLPAVNAGLDYALLVGKAENGKLKTIKSFFEVSQ